TGERVRFAKRKSRGKFDVGFVTEILSPSALRTQPRCGYFGLCGGCAKQRVLEDNLERLGKVSPDRILPPIVGPAWGYRNRARLSVHYVAKKGGVLVGFHEKKSSFVADTMSCEILPPHVAKLIPELREMFTAFRIRD